MRLDFVFQDMTFELDVNPLSAFKHLHTLDLNFYDNHRYFFYPAKSENVSSKQKLSSYYSNLVPVPKGKMYSAASGTHFLIRF